MVCFVYMNDQGIFARPPSLRPTSTAVKPVGLHPVMKTLKSEINYDLQDTALGGRIAITTTNPKAIDAIHRFLRFQIQDHRTGDSTDIQP